MHISGLIPVLVLLAIIVRREIRRRALPSEPPWGNWPGAIDRPWGVVILSTLSFIGGVNCLVGAWILAFRAKAVAAECATVACAGSDAFLLGLGPMAVVIFLVLAVPAFAIGVGMWKLRNWARIITIILVILGFLGGLLGLLGSLLHFQIFVPLYNALVYNPVFLTFYVLILWYMFLPHVKKAFGLA